MEGIIRKLTHNNRIFDSQWCKIKNELIEKYDKTNIASILDVLADYVLHEPKTPSPSENKFEFVTIVINELDHTNKHITDLSLHDRIFQIFIRVFDQGRIDQWHLTFLKQVYQHFELGQYLSQKLSLIHPLIVSLQKHPFKLTSTDESTLVLWQQFWCNDVFNQNLFNEKIFMKLKDKFQQLCRFALRNSSSSPFWAEFASHMMNNLPQLFSSYTNPTDSKHVLDLYHISENNHYKKLIRKSFSNDINLLKINYNQILLTIEQLVLKNDLYDAKELFEDVILANLQDISNIELLLQIFIRMSLKISVEQHEEFTNEILSNLCVNLKEMKVNKKLWASFFDLAIVILDLNAIQAPSCAKDLIAKENFYPWKDIGERLNKILVCCANYDQFINRQNSFFSPLDSLKEILRTICDQAKLNNNLFQYTHTQAIKCTIRWSSSPQQSLENKQQWPIHVYKMGIVMIDLIDRRRITVDIYAQILKKIYRRIQREDVTDQTEGTEQLFFKHLAKSVGIYTEILKTFPSSVHSLLNSIFVAILDRPLVNENGFPLFRHDIFCQLWDKVSETLKTEDDARIYEQAISKLYFVSRNETGDAADLFEYWSNFIDNVGIQFPQLVINRIDLLLKEFIERNQIGFMSVLLVLYPERPELFHERIDDLISASFRSSNAMNNQTGGVYLVLLQSIGKYHPEAVSLIHINHIFEYLSLMKSQNNIVDLYGLFQFLTPVASVKPSLFDKYVKDLIQLATKSKNIVVFTCLQQYFIASTIVNGEDVAKQHLSTIILLLGNKTDCTQENRKLILHACVLIGIRHRKVIEERRKDFVAINCTELIYFIDSNKIIEDNKQTLEQFQKEIRTIEKRIFETDIDIRRQEFHTTDMHTQANSIDAKTYSYVPTWAGNVCKLLNRKASNDWRLLGQRFGYSASELRHWATQPDPSIALLNEWYMTHQTDEATFGLIKILKEIGRQDVEQIIRKVVKDAGETIPDDLSNIEVHRFPPIFISYHWNAQTMVSKLKDHLVEAGYLCSMDMEQMNEKQPLSSKVEKNIRGAKVILCCIDQEYAKSDICISQVNFALSIGTPIVPLQMEQKAWQPGGALNTLMNEYLFIRFFDQKATNDQSFWLDNQFKELLGQIRYYVAPDPEMISKRYKDWFVPRLENLVFLKQSTFNIGSTKVENSLKTSLVNSQLRVIDPQIMISYQWDRQSDIIDLYKRLTDLGYRVWLDIFQMDGGDSLFTKMNASMRNAICLIACVTSKYTLSANCRREISLANALSKPIIPLLLEALNEHWPPAGPMSLVFTGKSYIDFRSHQKNNMWQGKEYDQLLVKLTELMSKTQSKLSNRHLVNVKTPSSSSSNRFTEAATISTTTIIMQTVDSTPVESQCGACSIM